MKPRKVSSLTPFAPVLYGDPGAFFSVRGRGSVLHRTRPKCETRKKGARCAPDFAAKPPREQSSREGARADARRNAQSSSGGADLSAPNAMRGCDLRSFQCENEGAYYIVRDRSARHAKRAQGAPLIAFGGGGAGS